MQPNDNNKRPIFEISILTSQYRMSTNKKCLPIKRMWLHNEIILKNEVIGM